MHKYFVGAAIALAFVMGMYTCKTFGGSPDCPPVIDPLEGGKITDSTLKRTVDSQKLHKPQPVRETKPELATGKVPGPQVLRIPYPVYIRERGGDTCTHLYGELYTDYATRREYDIPFAFGEDSVRFKGAVQGNQLWDPEVILSRAQKTYYVREKTRNSLWFGANGGYRPLDSTVSIGASLMFLHKKGLAIEAGAELDTRGQLQYEGGVKWKIGRK